MTQIEVSPGTDQPINIPQRGHVPKAVRIGHYDPVEAAARRALYQELFVEAVDSDDPETRHRLGLLEKYNVLEWRVAKMHYEDRLPRAEIAKRLEVSGGEVHFLLGRFRTVIMDVSPESEGEKRQMEGFVRKLESLGRREEEESRFRSMIDSPDSDRCKEFGFMEKMDETAETARVVRMYYLDRKDPRQIAQELGVETNSIYSQLDVIRAWMDSSVSQRIPHVIRRLRNRLKKDSILNALESASSINPSRLI